MTAGELRNKLKGVPNSAPLFIVVDKSDDNYDDDGNLRQVHPIGCIVREFVIDYTGITDEPERNIIIHLDDGFYENYECKPKQSY